MADDNIDIEGIAAANEDNIPKIAEEHSPFMAIVAVEDKFDIERETARAIVEEVLPTTDGPGRRSMKYCLLCHPDWNGSYGDEENRAIAKYEIPDEPGEDQAFTGWSGVCEVCAIGIQHSEFEVHPLPGHDDHELFEEEDDEPLDIDCDHPSWFKVSLVTENEGHDIVQCEECDVYGKRRMPGDVEVVGFDRP